MVASLSAEAVELAQEQGRLQNWDAMAAGILEEL
jgi:hypothetical protein